MKNEYILIRTIDLLEFLKDAEDSFMLSIFKSNLKNNIIDSLPEESNKMGKNDITNNYIKFKNNEQSLLEFGVIAYNLRKFSDLITYNKKGQERIVENSFSYDFNVPEFCSSNDLISHIKNFVNSLKKRERAVFNCVFDLSKENFIGPTSIANHVGVTRQQVYNIINTLEDKLNQFEKSLEI